MFAQTKEANVLSNDSEGFTWQSYTGRTLCESPKYL